MMSTSEPTNITVRVIANDGKFLGDDVGGAAVTIRDAETQEILAQGLTKGDSGPNGKGGVMCEKLKRGHPIPMDERPDDTSHYTATVLLSAPRRIEVTAFGPLAARGSANTTSITTWIYPGQHITAGNGVLLELRGLICQITNPPTHTVYKQPASFDITANVAMMCGCPISEKEPDTPQAICPCPAEDQPWRPGEFEVFAKIEPDLESKKNPIPMCWDGKTAGRFTASLSDVMAGTYQVTVCAEQKHKGNTGVDFSTFIIPKPSPPKS